MKPQKTKRPATLRVRLSEAEKRAVQAAAEALGLAPSAWARMVLRKEAGK